MKKKVQASGIGATVGDCKAQLLRFGSCRHETVNRLGVDSCVVLMGPGYCCPNKERVFELFSLVVGHCETFVIVTIDRVCCSWCLSRV